MVKLRIKDLREDQLERMNQDYVADHLNVTRSTYSNWENGETMIPLEKLDEIAMLFNTSLAYVLGIGNKGSTMYGIKPMNYDLMIKNLNKARIKCKLSHQDIATKLGCSKSKSYRIFNGIFPVKINDLVALLELLDLDLDKISGKL